LFSVSTQTPQSSTLLEDSHLFLPIDIIISASMPSSENAQSIKVLDELMQKLTISKEASAIKEASAAIASFINGRIEDLDTPTK
jgi:hypothetical protein